MELSVVLATTAEWQRVFMYSWPRSLSILLTPGWAVEGEEEPEREKTRFEMKLSSSCSVVTFILGVIWCVVMDEGGGEVDIRMRGFELMERSGIICEL